MIPIQLTLEGLYSYQERQTIDFKSLTEAGLFGIFGSVGSGKSSILEAITFALYGETERLHSRDKRAYNMMNLKSNRFFIEFDFYNFENKKFRAIREFERNSKNFEDVKPYDVTFYEWKENRWEPLPHVNTKEIINLTYENFKRTIIIPQGQFKEFLELKATDRTNMMKEIFNLSKFDLQGNVSTLNAKNKSDLDQLEGQLKGFEEINEEQISVQKENLILQQKKFEKVKNEFSQIEKKYQLQKNLKIDFELLNQKQESFKKLSLEKTDIDLLEKQTERFDQVFRLFNPLISEKNKLQKEIEFKKKEQKNQGEILAETEAKFNLLKKDIEAILPQYEVLDQSKIQENDLSLLLQMLQFSDEIKILKERTEKGSEKVKEVTENQKVFKEKIEVLVKNSEFLKSQRLDAQLLLNVGNWFSKKKNLAETLQIQNKKITDFKLEIEKVLEELKPFNINLESFKNDFELKNETLEIQKKLLSEKRNHLQVQQQLSHFSTELHDGESCPLCGALEHPNVVEFEDVQIELATTLKQIEEVENQQKEIQKSMSEIEKILDRKKFFESQLKAEEETFNQLNTEVENHQSHFRWKEFNSEKENDFELKRNQSFDLEKQIEEVSKTISQEQNNLEKERESLEKFNKALEDFKLKEKEVETKFQTNQSNLKNLSWANFQGKSFEEVEESYQNLSKSNLKTEQDYQSLMKQEKELSPKFAEQKTISEQLGKRISELEKEISENGTVLIQYLEAHQFNDLKEVETILGQEINVQNNRNQVQKFKIDFETLKNGVDELALKLKDFSFDEAQFAALETQFKSGENDLKIANDNVVKLASEIDRLEKEFKKKEELLKELSKLQKRADHLKTMTNLFKGAGFVQYVSSIYLRQLCDHANIRFHRMTRNQLSLQLNENNDFEIVDFLNEGRSRSVKTLSGGQAFQVSLSLALALAESVQSNAQAEKNFFFIDEGFGTQDLESVNVVFETLTNLQKENRIVGIISHVEELKEKMPISLNVIKDEERGSLIT
ncbi:SMC family ATPase [Kaistella flava (ex Peng et al. 2021)]|uniref:SMC family ATPase n=1 Tax=Kaistella flava (ex Peng et al. 2021) TaxID=2038776 RepID=A0A7M2Y5Q9_9FLAO|nr:AAA family ATPase [Kaistella flava (ex Peng et al. 2021)]QOW09511.1 SMC family ATPase [Kaistella flava (ex Peng et al. 2021)]